MIIFGGEDASGLCNDLFIYNYLNGFWKKLSPKVNSPKPKLQKDYALYRNSLMFLFMEES